MFSTRFPLRSSVSPPFATPREPSVSPRTHRHLPQTIPRAPAGHPSHSCGTHPLHPAHIQPKPLFFPHLLASFGKTPFIVPPSPSTPTQRLSSHASRLRVSIPDPFEICPTHRYSLALD